MANKGKEKGEDSQERQVPEAVAKAYRDRLSHIKKARAYAAKNDIHKAVQNYKNYLEVLANYFDISEPELKPELFNDSEHGTPEKLLISHAYWDLAKAYDRNEKLRNESVRCLKQFVAFTEGEKFQHVNAQMVKKFIKRRRAYNLQAFEDVYDKIHVKSKGCFVATLCLGETHPALDNLRSLRDFLYEKPVGKTFVRFYYDYSPSLVDFLKRHRFLKSGFIYFTRPLVLLVSKIAKEVIDRDHS